MLENAPVLVCVPTLVILPTVMSGVVLRIKFDAAKALPVQADAVVAFPVHVVDDAAFPVKAPVKVFAVTDAA